MLSASFLGGKLDARTNALARMHDVITQAAGKRGDGFRCDRRAAFCVHSHSMTSADTDV